MSGAPSGKFGGDTGGGGHGTGGGGGGRGGGGGLGGGGSGGGGGCGGGAGLGDFHQYGEGAKGGGGGSGYVVQHGAAPTMEEHAPALPAQQGNVLHVQAPYEHPLLSTAHASLPFLETARLVCRRCAS